MTFKINDKVKVKQTATKYVTGQTIPQFVKDRTETITKIDGDKVVLKPSNSWYYIKDIEHLKTNEVKGLETGDTMKMYDKNGKELGTWTFKAK